MIETFKNFKMIKIIKIICLLLSCGFYLASSERRNPLKDPRICGRPQCEPETTKFAYNQNKRYDYDYKLHIRSEFFGSGTNTSDLYLTARISLTFPRNCEGVLIVSNIELKDNDQDVDYYEEYGETEDNLHSMSSQMADDLYRYELRFAYHDGVIGEVCPHPTEPTWVLNFKKGILSAFQNTMLRFDVDLNTVEVDVSGSCNVVYSLIGAVETSVHIKKTKDLETCRDRYKTHSILQSSPYFFRQNKEIWPILNSTSYCNLTVDHNVYQEIDCYERHQLVPFSQNRTGAVTETHSKFVLTHEEILEQADFFPDEDEEIIKRRSPLLFDHTPSPKPTHGEIKASRDLLKQMCTIGFPNIQREFIEVFTKFLRTARSLSYTALQQLVSRAGSICNNGRNHISESLPYIGSMESVQLMKDLLISKQLSQERAQSWMISLAYLPHPTEQVLETFYALIEFGKLSLPEYVLGSTAVIHTYCRQNPDCENNEKVQLIVNYLETEIINFLAGNLNQRKNKERFVILLKGIGNIGVMSEAFVKRLKETIKDNNIPVELRTQTIMAFRRINCYKNSDYFLDLYGNFTENSEVRIFAYLQAMRCPNYISINKIKNVLQTEEVNQVGSYVWSHLSNLAKSASPVRIEAQGLLVDNDLGSKYRLDIRKFSRNYEHSVFFDEYNFGTTSEANIIFGTDSYIPRVLSLNFTADLFGESVNFFEISARLQGFEQIVESIFGVDGPLSAENLRKKFSFLNTFISKTKEEKIVEMMNLEKIRLRRETDKNIEKEISQKHKKRSPNNKDFQRNIDKLGYNLKYKYNDPRAVFGVKVFGNDLKYHTIEGGLEVMAMAQNLNPLQNIAKLLSGNEITYTKSGVFLDASYNVPLSAGLPLSIHAFGACSVDLRVSGNLDVDKTNPEEKWHFDIEGKIKPSISVDVHTTMETDFYYAFTGIRVKSNLYSSSAVESKLKIRGAKQISLTLSLPQDRNDIFSARSELIVMTTKGDIPQRGIPTRFENSTCTWPIIDRAVGLKICTNYSLPDVSLTVTDHPSLLLCGPINLNVHLDKADPTAKTFLFEYRSDTIENNTVTTFVFETPDSVIPRNLVANLTRNAFAANMSMSFHNGENSHSAVGRYKNTEEDKELEIYLDSNGRKSFSIEMYINRSEVRNGWLYSPHMLLTVNNDRIAGLAGTVKRTQKKGIVQNDLSITFETKKLQARLVGYIMKSEVSCATRIKVDYRDNKIETVDFDGELADRSQKAKTEYQGRLRLQSSAYQKYNFASNMTWLSLLGHTEAKLTVNNANDLLNPDFTTTIRAIFARSSSEERQSEGLRTTASLEVTRPISKVDYRILFKHEEKNKKGPVHNFLGAIRYAPKKEATAVFSLFYPQRYLFAMDASMNITVPTFDSCAARLLLVERQQNDYSIDFLGSWFSGHSIKIQGAYQDKSTRIRVHHYLKLLVKSPSFEDTTVNVVYRRNELEILFDIQAEYDKIPYGLTLKHSARDDSQLRSYLEIKYQNRTYWISAKMLSTQPKLLLIEIHIDKLRDIHLKIRGLSNERKKEASFEMKWDANRDPSQRLALVAELNNPAYKTYDGSFMLTYPERTFSCSFASYIGGPHYNGNGRVSWSPSEAIVLAYNAGLLPEEITNIWIESVLTTPFESWTRNSIKAGLYNKGNQLQINASALWAENQNIALIYKSDYEITDFSYGCDIEIALNSTIYDVPTIIGHVKHKHEYQKMNTDLAFSYALENESLQVYSLKSDWQTNKDEIYRNVTGSILMRSPIEGYRMGALLARFAFVENRNLKGAAALSLEERKFTLALEGYAKKLTDNGLVINITTPIERFKTVTGRFGLNEYERHAVAEIRSPQGALGAEVLLAVIGFADFNVKLSLATPLEAFRRVALISKMKAETIDLRGEWNNVTLGFTGIWRLFNATDFEYAYRVFTPFKDFEDNGFVVKLIKAHEFNMELSMKFSKYKVGIKVNAKPKPKLITELNARGLELQLLKKYELNDIEYSESEEEEDEDYEIDYDELLNYVGSMELNTLIWPTITGNVDIEEIGDFFIVTGEVNLAQGKIDIRDRLYFPHFLKVKNLLTIQTPFVATKEIKSKFEYDVEFKKRYVTGLSISIQKEKRTIDLGFLVNYTISIEEFEAKIHDIVLNIRTPFETMESLRISGNLELEENVYRCNITGKTPITLLSVAGSIESEENFIDVFMGIILETIVVPHYGCKVYFKKDLSELENTIVVGFDINDNGTNNRLRAECAWNGDKNNFINAKGRIYTNILPLKSVGGSILVTKIPHPLTLVELTLSENSGDVMEFRVRAARKKDALSFDLSTPLKELKNVTVQGFLTKSSTDGLYKFIGKMNRNTQSYNLNGFITFKSDIPVDVKLRLQPNSGGPDGVIEYQIRNSEGDFGKIIRISVAQGKLMFEAAGGYSIRNYLSWDVTMLIQSSEPEIERINIDINLIPNEKGHVIGNAHLTTPWKHLSIDSVHLNTNLSVKPETGFISGTYDFGSVKGHGFCEWTWVILENMQFSIESVIEKNKLNPRLLEVCLSYKNPNKNFQRLSTRGKLNVDSKWILEANGTALYISSNDFTFNINTQLPQPVGDIHHITGRYRGYFMQTEAKDVSIEAKYESDLARNIFATKGYYRNINDLQGLGRIEWGPNERMDSIEGSLQVLHKGPIKKEFSVRFATPLYNQVDTFLTSGSYDHDDSAILLACSINYPSTRPVADVDINYSSLSNMRGHLNSTTPFLNTTWLRADFNFVSTGAESNRYIKASWPNNYAFVDLKSKYSSHNLNRDLQGNIKIEIPLATRHYGNVDFGLKERPLITTGHANVMYNSTNVLIGKYTCKSEERAGFEKDVVDISIENKLKPIGIHYINSRQYTDTEYPEYSMKHVEIFELRNSSAFNITAEVHLRSTFTGQEYKIIAMHPNRTVIFTSEFDSEDTTTQQKSKLQLADNVWIGYEVQLQNLTTEEQDYQKFVVRLSYPKRNISTEGYYKASDGFFDSNIAFKWNNISKHDNKPRIVKAGVKWQNEPLTKDDKDNQTLIITIGHPSFSQDAKIKGYYYRGRIDLIKALIIANYSKNPDHLVKFQAIVKDLTNIVKYRNYSLDITGNHKVSKFDLDVKGSAEWQPTLYQLDSHAHYKRGFLPIQKGLFLCHLDLPKKIIHYYRMTPFKTVRLWSQSYGAFPIYGINATVWDSPDINSTGFFFIDLYDKVTRMEVNLTSDASQNLQMIGFIPDARSAYFDVWRNYEEIRVIDIAYYLRMNHSRLVTSQLHWRPKIKNEIKEKLKDISASFYDSFSDGIDFWIKTLYTETMDTLNDIWNNGKPYTQEFLDDISELSVLEEDIENFRIFANQSYEANDFYIKTLVNFTLTIIDELALRDQIESLPKILTEVWQVMGDSGKALRKSIIWLIETIKSSYQKALQAISRFLHGESLEHLSVLMEKAIERYDKFVKDLHLSFIKYVQRLWIKLTNVIGNYWKAALKKLEPHVFKFLHYLDSALWNLSKEIFDFIYKRTNELAESPYFNQVSSFTQDLDHLYKDFIENDAFTNFKKYSKITWDFIKEKYFKIVPFGKELNDVITELWEEIETLQDLETFKFITNKMNELELKAEWLASEFELKKRLHQLWSLIRNKIVSYTQNALQTDDRYREAKTLFIFDPDVGIMDLEQKLPMSWHAFNETPKFEEIPEYKSLIYLNNIFGGTNFSLWDYLIEIRQNLDPKMWLPPYRAHSLLIGSRHYMTFDGKYIALKFVPTERNHHITHGCSYVMAHDFFNKNFTLMLESTAVKQSKSSFQTNTLSLAADANIFVIDIKDNMLLIGYNSTTTLPMQKGKLLISRDLDILTIESPHEFKLGCNMQFDLCWFELEGWHFGQTAGILGTMNNEPFDDLLTSNGIITSNKLEFVNSWKIDNCYQNIQKPDNVYNAEIVELCTEFFKTPYFSNCFNSLDPHPFYTMCLDIGQNTIPSLLKTNHPVQKGACTTALAYIQACKALKIPLRIPDKCIHCPLQNGTYVGEGTFTKLEDTEVPQIADVVFIIEAKPCNENITNTKNIMTVVNSLEQELNGVGLSNIRYAVIVFGGNKPFDEPRSIVHNSKVFTNYQELKPYFEHIQTGNGSNKDIFEAFSIASKLIFRPGASKNFILLPCSDCSAFDMKFDYSSLLQLMLEEGITLHVLMDNEFLLDKPRLNRIFFGMDSEYAYSKRDLKELKGDTELRKQVRIPKEELGLCNPLALETNGSIFTAQKLIPERKNPIKKFATIFTKRVAKSAIPNSCQICECTGHNTGVAFMICTSCKLPSPVNIEYDFDETGTDFNWDWDEDDEMI